MDTGASILGGAKNFNGFFVDGGLLDAGFEGRGVVDVVVVVLVVVGGLTSSKSVP